MRLWRTFAMVAAVALPLSAAAASRESAANINCNDAMKKPMGQQTQAEYDACTKPALQKALCDAVAEAARTNGCGRGGAEDPRCGHLANVLLTCVRNGGGLGQSPQHGGVR